MKKYLCIYCLLCMATLACAQNLKFNANGKFKIVQFTAYSGAYPFTFR